MALGACRSGQDGPAYSHPAAARRQRSCQKGGRVVKITAAQGGIDGDAVKDVALRVAAADGHVAAHAGEVKIGIAVFTLAKGFQPGAAAGRGGR